MKIFSKLQKGIVRSQVIMGRIGSALSQGRVISILTTGAEAAPVGNFILMESSGYILLEDGSKIILE